MNAPMRLGEGSLMPEGSGDPDPDSSDAPTRASPIRRLFVRPFGDFHDFAIARSPDFNGYAGEAGNE